jgi:hypothetical protein
MRREPVAVRAIRLATERDHARRDLEQALDSLEQRLLPGQAARRLVVDKDAALVLAGVAAAGLALGLVRDESPTTRAMALVAGIVAGAMLSPR